MSKTHPLFSELFSTLARQGYFASNDALHKWRQAGEPMLEEEPLKTTNVAAPTSLIGTPEMTFYCTGCASKADRIKELEDAGKNFYALHRQSEARVEELGEQIKMREDSLTSQSERIEELEAKLAGAEKNWLGHPAYRNGRNEALEEAAKEAETAKFSVGIGSGLMYATMAASPEIAARIRALKKP